MLVPDELEEWLDQNDDFIDNIWFKLVDQSISKTSDTGEKRNHNSTTKAATL